MYTIKFQRTIYIKILTWWLGQFTVQPSYMFKLGESVKTMGVPSGKYKFQSVTVTELQTSLRVTIACSYYRQGCIDFFTCHRIIKTIALSNEKAMQILIRQTRQRLTSICLLTGSITDFKKCKTFENNTH